MDLLNLDKNLFTFWLRVSSILLLKFGVKSFPLLVKVLSVVIVLLDCELFLLGDVHSQSFFKGKWIDLLENGFQGNQTFLKNSIWVS